MRWLSAKIRPSVRPSRSMQPRPLYRTERDIERANSEPTFMRAAGLQSVLNSEQSGRIKLSCLLRHALCSHFNRRLFRPAANGADGARMIFKARILGSDPRANRRRRLTQRGLIYAAELAGIPSLVKSGARREIISAQHLPNTVGCRLPRIKTDELATNACSDRASE